MISILVLRSYGDYVILLNAVKVTSLKEEVELYVSIHLHELHKALRLNFPQNFTFHFIDLGIKKGLLSFFTNKNFFTLSNLKELTLLQKQNKLIGERWQQADNIYLEQFRRSRWLSFLLGFQFKELHRSGKIYDSFSQFFKNSNPVSNVPLSLNQNSSIVIFPDSRKQEKELTASLLFNLKNALIFKYINVRVAKFGRVETDSVEVDNLLHYSNFEELVEIIQGADFIISSDSLPAHIAELYKKPHWIFYSKIINTEWLTPSASALQYYCTFDQLAYFEDTLIK